MDCLERLVYYHYKRAARRLIFEESNFGKIYYSSRLTRTMCERVLQSDSTGEWAFFEFLIKTHKKKRIRTFSLILNDESSYILYDDRLYGIPIMKKLSIIDSSALLEPDPKYWRSIIRRLGLCDNNEFLLKYTMTRRSLCKNSLDRLLEFFDCGESDSASWSVQ